MDFLFPPNKNGSQGISPNYTKPLTLPVEERRLGVGLSLITPFQPLSHRLPLPDLCLFCLSLPLPSHCCFLFLCLYPSALPLSLRLSVFLPNLLTCKPQTLPT